MGRESTTAITENTMKEVEVKTKDMDEKESLNEK